MLFGAMAFPDSNRSRWLATLLLAAFVALLGIGLKNNFAGPSYDSLHSLAALHGKIFDDPRVVIVYLDRASFEHEHQNPADRWPRHLHARLLQRLTEDGARAVVFDILFDTPSGNDAADDAFAAALKINSRAILAAEHNDKNAHETAASANRTRAILLRLPEQKFSATAAGWGVASLSLEKGDDFVVRKHLPEFGTDGTPSLSLATARFIGATNSISQELWVRYYGPAITIPHVSYSEALEAAALPPKFFKDKIVFIGARPMEGFMDARRDEFRSPFHSWSNKEFFMPGVEIHATLLLNLLRGDALKQLSNLAENFLLLAVAMIFGGGLLWLRPVSATVISVVGAGMVLLLALAGFSANLWFPWLVVCAVQIPLALFGSWLWQFQEWFFTRRKLEAAKRIADAKIREQAALLDKANDAILVQDLAGQIFYANPSAEKMFGWKLSELTTRAVAEIFSPAREAAVVAQAEATQAGEWNGELKFQTRAGNLVIAASRWTLIRDDDGNPSSLLLINSDITEQKNLEQQFLRTQRMNTIGTLAGGMAHDLNNALAPVLMGAQWLRRKSDDAEARAMLTMIETSANRGADMVRQVLLFARGRGGEFERLDLAPLIRELEKMVRETFPKNISVETFLPRDLWPVQGNFTQLHQVVLNLCVNARDAMSDGGKISFVADNVELSADELNQLRKTSGSPTAFSPSPLLGERAALRGHSSSNAFENSNEKIDPSPSIPLPSEVRGKSEAMPPLKFVSLSVSDTGTGMTPEVQAKIFEPFFTTKGEGKGTGIGLATVVRIVKSHGGFLRVESEVGQGTTFEIFIPHAPEAASPTAAKTEETLPRGHGELILVADDEQALCELVAAELTDFGYRVLTANNGAEAVALFQQHAEEIRLFITDDSMPVMSGRQAIAAIRQLRADLPVITTSGDGAKNISGATELIKPFGIVELLNAVSRSLK